MYLKLVASGQIHEGDRLIIVGRDGRVLRRKARIVLNPYTDKEEIVFNKSSNLYFITAMVIDGSSWAKAVAYEPNLTQD